MPRVGSKHFSYSSKGRKAAKRLAKKTGKKVRSKGGSKKMKGSHGLTKGY